MGFAKAEKLLPAEPGAVRCAPIPQCVGVPEMVHTLEKRNLRRLKIVSHISLAMVPKCNGTPFYEEMGVGSIPTVGYLEKRRVLVDT